jgi:large subunit ribosomal protein LP1
VVQQGKRGSHLTIQSSELAATYAALILADDGLEITVSYPLQSPNFTYHPAACLHVHKWLPITLVSRFTRANSTNPQGEKITTLTSAANVEVEAIWASLLAKALDGKDVKELLTNVGGGGAPAAGGAAVAASGDAAPAEEKKEEKKEEAKEESDDDMVCLSVLYEGKALIYRASVYSINRLDLQVCRIIKNSLGFYACTGPSMHVAVPSIISVIGSGVLEYILIVRVSSQFSSRLNNMLTKSVE